MSTPEDNSVAEYERGNSEISQHYRELRADEVPSAMDEKILGQARDELRKANRARRWREWAPPFALAASAVLALSILFRSGTEREPLIAPQAPQPATTAPPSSMQGSSNQPATPAA